jgi:hypothetical protein
MLHEALYARLRQLWGYSQNIASGAYQVYVAFKVRRKEL